MNKEIKLLVFLPILALVSFQAFDAFADVDLDDETITVTGEAGQTANLLLLENSAGTDEFWVEIDGDLFFVGDIQYRSGTGFYLTLGHAITANRTATFPDATGDVMIVADAVITDLVDVNITACTTLTVLKQQANGTFVCVADEGTGDSISEGNSYVAVNDTGTGQIEFLIDGQRAINITSDVMTFLNKTRYIGTGDWDMSGDCDDVGTGAGTYSTWISHCFGVEGAVDYPTEFFLRAGKQHDDIGIRGNLTGTGEYKAINIQINQMEDTTNQNIDGLVIAMRGIGAGSSKVQPIQIRAQASDSSFTGTLSGMGVTIDADTGTTNARGIRIQDDSELGSASIYDGLYIDAFDPDTMRRGISMVDLHAVDNAIYLNVDATWINSSKIEWEGENYIMSPTSSILEFGSANFRFNDTSPSFQFVDTSQGADEKIYEMEMTASLLRFNTNTDDGSAQSEFFRLGRAGNVATDIQSSVDIAIDDTKRLCLDAVIRSDGNPACSDTFIVSPESNVFSIHAGSSTIERFNVTASAIQSSEPLHLIMDSSALNFRDTSEALDEKQYKIETIASILRFMTVNDAESASTEFFRLNRNADTPIDIQSSVDIALTPTSKLCLDATIRGDGNPACNDTFLVQSEANVLSLHAGSSTAERLNITSTEVQVGASIDLHTDRVKNTGTPVYDLTNRGDAGSDVDDRYSIHYGTFNGVAGKQTRGFDVTGRINDTGTLKGLSFTLDANGTAQTRGIIGDVNAYDSGKVMGISLNVLGQGTATGELTGGAFKVTPVATTSTSRSLQISDDGGLGNGNHITDGIYFATDIANSGFDHGIFMVGETFDDSAIVLQGNHATSSKIRWNNGEEIRQEDAGTITFQTTNIDRVFFRDTSPFVRIAIPDDVIHTGLRINNTDGFVEFGNGLGIAGRFVPLIDMKAGGNTGDFSLIRGQVNIAQDAGATPVIVLEVEQDDGTAIINRNYINIRNAGTDVWSINKNDDVSMHGNHIINLAILNFNDATELTISSGIITATQSFHSIDGSGDASDDLDTINGGAEGDLITIVAEHPDRTITVTENGNLLVDVAGNFAMDNSGDTWSAIYNGTHWLETSRSNND